MVPPLSKKRKMPNSGKDSISLPLFFTIPPSERDGGDTVPYKGEATLHTFLSAWFSPLYRQSVFIVDFPPDIPLKIPYSACRESEPPFPFCHPAAPWD